MIFEIAHQIGIVPLLWIAFLRFRGRDLGAAWFWLAGAFGASWLADTAAHWMNPWMTSPVYLVSQASIIGLVFLSRSEALGLIVALTATAVGAILWRGVSGPDVLLHTVAWLSVGGIIWQLKQLDRLRISLLVYFGVGWVAWMLYCASPGWTFWIAYQFVRLSGILLFCWAASDPLPHFALSSSGRARPAVRAR